MRYLRKQVLNRRAPWDQRLSVDINNAVVMQTTNNLTLPSGTTAQRPVSPVTGMIRYNTDITPGGELEVYQSNNWRSIRYKESTAITQQNLGAGDGENLYFGPLNPAPPMVNRESNTSWGGQNLIVLVENVLQISNTNYDAVLDPLIPTETYTPTTSVIAAHGLNSRTIYFNSHVLGTTTAEVAGGAVTLHFIEKPQPPFAVGTSITVSGFIPNSYNGIFLVSSSTVSSVTFNGSGIGTIKVAGQIKSANAKYTSVDLIGASVSGHSSIPNGTTVSSFTYDLDTDALDSVVLTNDITASDIPRNTQLTITEAEQTKSGYYLKFTSPVPYGKLVTVIHGFDK